MTELTLGSIDELEDGVPALRKVGERRFACVRRGEAIDVLDDRCPHEGYPLSEGVVRDGVLTCRWHNWKFELETGRCSFGGEPVRRYPARVDARRLVVIDTRLDEAAERARIEASLIEGMREGAPGSVMRDALRLGVLGGAGSLAPALGVIAADAARRAPWGFEHGLAMLADVAQWIDEGLVRGPEAFAAVSGHVSEPLIHAPPRAPVAPRAADPADLLDALDEERRDDAEAIARHLVREGRLDDLYTRAILPWLARDLTEYGHGLIYASKARELAARFESAAEDVIAALVVALGWCVRDSALPGWRATHEGARAARAVGEGAVDDAYVDDVLRSERGAVDACLARLAAGASPRALIVGGARAAAERVRRFDTAWEARTDAPVTILDVSHLVTFAEAALSTSADADPSITAAFAVQLAGFVGKLRAADGTPPDARPDVTLRDALHRRDLAGALGASEPPATHDRLVAEHALHDAFVRPIFAAHAIKTTEAVRRLERADPSHAPAYRAALATVIVPRRRERYFARTAQVASAFLATGRPPPGLY